MKIILLVSILLSGCSVDFPADKNKINLHCIGGVVYYQFDNGLTILGYSVAFNKDGTIKTCVGEQNE